MSAADDFAEAQRRIEEAIEEGATELDLSDLQDLEELPGDISFLTDLRSLRLGRNTHSMKISDISALQNLSALEHLDLCNTHVADITPIQDLTALQYLYLSGTQVSVLEPIQGLSVMQSLYLNNTQVADIAPLQGLSAIQRLHLSNSPVVDISHLQGLSALRKLFLDNTQVADITPLQCISALKSLDLTNTQVADIAPLQGHSALQHLYLFNSQVADMRPLLGLEKLCDPNTDSPDLRFHGTPATAASPRLSVLSEIGPDEERVNQTVAYLRTLPPYPEPMPWEISAPAADTHPNAPQSDPILKVTVTNGNIDIDHVLPSEADQLDPIKARLYERMQAAIGELVRLGNRYPEINGPANALKTILDQPFAEADLFDIHVEIASLTDLIAVNPDKSEAEQLDADCLATLKKVTRLGPPLTLGTPEVDLFEARNLEYAQIKRVATIPHSERLIAAALAVDTAPLTDRARHLAEITAHAPDEGRIAGVRVSYIKNILVQGVGPLASGAVGAVYGHEVVSAYEWALTFLTTNKDAIMTVAPSWIANGQVWAADLIARSAELLDELRRRKGDH